MVILQSHVGFFVYDNQLYPCIGYKVFSMVVCVSSLIPAGVSISIRSAAASGLTTGICATLRSAMHCHQLQEVLEKRCK